LFALENKTAAEFDLIGSWSSV